VSYTYYKMAVFEPELGRWKIVSDILITTVTLDTYGRATINIPPGVVPRVFVEQKGLEYTFSISVDTTTGQITIQGVYRSIGLVRTTVVASVTASTGTAVTGVTVTTGVKVTGITVSTSSVTSVTATTSMSVVTGITVSTASSVDNISVSTATVVTSVGDDVGFWTADTYGNLSHTHAVATATAVTGISVTTGVKVTGVTVTTKSVTSVTGTTTVSVVSSVTATTGVTVDAVSVSTGSVVTSVSISTTSVVTAVVFDYLVAAGIPLQVIVIW